MQRRSFLHKLAATGVVAPALHATGLPAAHAQGVGRPGTPKSRTLRIIHGANLHSLDPLWTTATATKDYAFLTFDQLVAADRNYVPQPQMAEGWTVEDKGRSYVFKLREGLKFHDKEPVRAQDCVASIARWSKRDGFGQMLGGVTEAMQVIDDRSFRIRLKVPFPLLPAAIGKSNSSQCFIMPERMANTPADKQITEWIGSGPYRFLKDEWMSGARAAWARFEDYVPRREPVSGIAGARIPAMDRIEWSIISDASTALTALLAGEQDYWDAPPSDLIPVLKADANIAVDVRDKSGSYLMLQLNHLQAPFSNPAVRQAVAMAVKQEDFLRATVREGLPLHECLSFFACGNSASIDAGSAVLKTRSVDRAAKALKAAGYAGEKVVLLMTVDNAKLAAVGQVTYDLLRKIGMNVELVTTDFATMAQRRVSREPVAAGGWSAFVTAWSGSDVQNPAVHQLLHGRGGAGWFGWPKDDALEQLKRDWVQSSDPAEQARLLKSIQAQAFQLMPYVPLGMSFTEVAYRKNLTGVFPSLVNGAYWNIGKKA